MYSTGCFLQVVLMSCWLKPAFKDQPFQRKRLKVQMYCSVSKNPPFQMNYGHQPTKMNTTSNKPSIVFFNGTCECRNCLCQIIRRMVNEISHGRAFGTRYGTWKTAYFYPLVGLLISLSSRLHRFQWLQIFFCHAVGVNLTRDTVTRYFIQL